jgi:hypothetical protein
VLLNDKQAKDKNVKHARAAKQKYTAEKVKSSLRERGVHIRTLTRGGMVEESRDDDLLHKTNVLDAKSHAAKPKSGRLSRYACDMCGSKFTDSKYLRQHRKNAQTQHLIIFRIAFVVRQWH